MKPTPMLTHSQAAKVAVLKEVSPSQLAMRFPGLCCDNGRDLPACRRIDGAALSRRLFPQTRLGTFRAVPFAKKALQVRTAAGVTAMPNIIKQAAAELVALRPAAGEKIQEIEWRTRLQC